MKREITVVLKPRSDGLTINDLNRMLKQNTFNQEVEHRLTIQHFDGTIELTVLTELSEEELLDRLKWEWREVSY